MPLDVYTANLIQKAKKNGTAYQGPATVYLALVTDVPTPTVVGTEVDDATYARLSFNQTTGWTDDDAGGLVATNALTWPEATADYPEDVEAIEVYTLASGGQRLWYYLLDQPVPVLAGTSFELQAGEFIDTVA